jgi:hypothetical protein
METGPAGLNEESVEILADLCSRGHEGYCMVDTTQPANDAVRILNRIASTRV